jgi:hypothetical protein
MFMLTLVGASLVAASPATAAPAPQAEACTSNCLQVYSITMYDYLQTEDVTAIVQIVDELDGGVRSAVIHGVWTFPDGSTQDQYAVTGTRLRGEFPLYTSQTGTFTFTVVGVTKAGYVFDPVGSVILSNSITIGDSGGGGGSDGCTVDCLSVTSIRMSERRGDVRATATVVDENGAKVATPTVEGTWTLPDGSTVAQTVTASNKGKAKFSVPVGDSGDYTLTIDNVTHAGDTYDPSSGVTSNTITVK